MKKICIALLRIMAGLWVMPWVGALLCLFVVALILVWWMISGRFETEVFIRAITCGVPFVALAGVGFYYSEVEPYS